MKTAILSVIAAALVLAINTASALPPVVIDFADVNGTAMPWLTKDNPTLPYGENNGTPPVAFSAADGFNFTTGSEFVIVALSLDSGIDPGGDTKEPIKDVSHFPIQYVDKATYPADLSVLIGALIGVFTDAGGKVVGKPFLVGANITVDAPAGAAQLQFGVNDDNYLDNKGKVTVFVGQSVPDHGNTAILLGFGLLGMMAIGRSGNSMAVVFAGSKRTRQLES